MLIIVLSHSGFINRFFMVTEVTLFSNSVWLANFHAESRRNIEPLVRARKGNSKFYCGVLKYSGYDFEVLVSLYGVMI